MPPEDHIASPPMANPGYAGWQLAKALQTAGTHADPTVRERAEKKARQWTSVLEGMMSGRLNIGTRQPVQDQPVWATPEVVTGGFATGQLLAAGSLQEHEEALLRRIPNIPGLPERQILNAYFLSEGGLAELWQQLQSGFYEIGVPEEGALLVVAWLVAHQQSDAARELLEILAPYFAELRFYPRPSERAQQVENRVYLENVGVVRERVREVHPQRRVLTQREAIQVWIPLYDRMVRLFLETVEGDLPGIRPGVDGAWRVSGASKFSVTGGWPCRKFPADWQARAFGILAEHDRLRATPALCGRPERKRDSFAQLSGYLRRCAEAPASLTGRDVGMIRLILARSVTKRGAPGSEIFEKLRAHQKQQAGGVAFHEIASLIEQRLAAYPAEEGLEDVRDVLAPITMQEAGRAPVPQGTPIPESFCRKVFRCFLDTVEALVERGVITSAEVLARVAPQFTSGLRAAEFTDETLCRLYAAIYRAFRRRRSLLLLHLERQVRIEELPWIAKVEPFRSRGVSAEERSRRALKEMALTTFRAFPQTLVPNKLLQEMRAMAQGAAMKLPLLEELAADIFMDDFSPKYTEVAKAAASQLEGSLYARYYDLNEAAVQSLPDAVSDRAWRWRWNSRPQKNPLVDLCITRAGVSLEMGWDVARNGMIIEQAQILTTHNLATLFQAFDLADALREELFAMAQKCFRWICQRQQMKTDEWHAVLIMVKNTAYAWRQMIFYLSQLPASEVEHFLVWAAEFLNEQSEDFRTQFSSALLGLTRAQRGQPVENQDETETGGRRFLGWTKKRPWMIPPRIDERKGA